MGEIVRSFKRKISSIASYGALILKYIKGFYQNAFSRFKWFSIFSLVVLAFFANFLFVQGKSNDGTNLQAALLSIDLSHQFDFYSEEDYQENNLFIQPAKAVFKESPSLLVTQDNSLLAVTTPNTFSVQTLGILVGVQEEDFVPQREEIIEYEIQQGDSLSGIAEKFGISLNTLLWANDLRANSKIKLGNKLVILPVSGVLHYVKAKDTILQIASTYKSEVNKIIAFNGLSGADDIYIGDILVVPDGIILVKSKPKVASGTPSSQIPIGSSYFIAPIGSPYIITQGLHWYNAIDFGHPGGSPATCGKPVYATAGGTVQRVSMGYNGGAGNNLTILHSNGVVTSYGHIKSSLVSPGQEVSQGQTIALIGGTPGTPGAGISTGCHVHFSVRGAKNPFAR